MYYVYIMTNRCNGTLYIGVTNQIWRRVREHRDGVNDGFTKKYGLKRLVYYEVHGDINRAIKREKTLKNWQRKWKLDLVESINPTWMDLYEFIYEQGNLLCIDPQSKSGRTLVALNQKHKATSKNAENKSPQRQ
jgi:putative endonuclease